MFVYRKSISIVISLILIASLTGCRLPRTTEKQSYFHDETREIEEYILASMGDYICFSQPIIDDERNQFCMYASLVTDYISDEEKAHDFSPVEVMELTRQLFNDFIVENPSYIDEKYTIFLFFYIDPDYIDFGGQTAGEQIGLVSSTYRGGKTDFLCEVNYSHYLNAETVLCVDCNGIKQVELYYESDVDDILTIIDHMPDLECVVVRSLYDIKDTLSELRPDITFIER